MISAAPSYLSDREVVRLHLPQFPSLAITSDDLETQENATSSASIEDARRSMVAEWVASHLDPLRNLAANWDTYGGQPLTIEALDAAQRLATALLLEGHPWPAFVPRADGGVSIVWNRPSIELAFELPASLDPLGDASVFFADETVPSEWEAQLDLADPRIGAAFDRLVG